MNKMRLEAFSDGVIAILITIKDSKLKKATGNDLKGKIPPFFYISAVGLSFVNQWIAVTVYALVALMRLVPDRRIESKITVENN